MLDDLSLLQPAIGDEGTLPLFHYLTLDLLHQPVEQAVFGAGAGNNANSFHLFFFFIVCLNFKTAKFSSIDVSVSVVCKSSSRSSVIISPLFCIRDGRRGRC